MPKLINLKDWKFSENLSAILSKVCKSINLKDLKNSENYLHISTSLSKNMQIGDYEKGSKFMGKFETPGIFLEIYTKICPNL